MARGSQFLTMQTRLKDELGLHNSVAVGVDNLPVLKQALNRAYAQEYRGYDWPHLRQIYDKQTLNAGQQFYDLDSELNYERIDSVYVWMSGLAHRITRGITFDDYSVYDPAEDARSDPVLKWDIRFTDPADQLEVWPLPAAAQSIQFKGFRAHTRLVNDSDLCLLDDDFIVLRAASYLEKDKDRRRELSTDADEVLRVLKAVSKAAEATHQLGLGVVEDERPTKSVIRVS